MHICSACSRLWECCVRLFVHAVVWSAVLTGTALARRLAAIVEEFVASQDVGEVRVSVSESEVKESGEASAAIANLAVSSLDKRVYVHRDIFSS